MHLSEFREKFNYYSLNTLMQQYVDIKAECQDGLLLFRLGDFYELFFDDAAIASEILGLVLTSRTKGPDAAIPMCGMPFHALGTYLPKLISSGYKVAICEQLESPLEAKSRGGKAIVKRGIVQVFTPGTLIDESMVDAFIPNYLVGISSLEKSCSICFVDIGGCDIGVFDVCHDQLASEIEKLQPKEILVSRRDFDSLSQVLSQYKGRLIVQADALFDIARSKRSIEEFYSIASISSIGQLSSSQMRSLGAVVQYLNLTHNAKVKLPLPKLMHSSEFMLIDLVTQRNLELVKADAFEHSLFGVLNKTVTKSGSRLLFKYIKSPLVDVESVEQRLCVVEFLLKDKKLLEHIRNTIGLVPDLERSLARISLGRALLKDFLTVKIALQVADSLKRTFARYEGVPLLLELILSAIQAMPELFMELDLALKTEDVPLNPSEGGFIKGSYNAKLDDLRRSIEVSFVEQSRLRSEYARITGIEALKIQQNNLVGMFVEVPIKQAHKVGNNFFHKQTTLNSARFSTLELSELEKALRDARLQASSLELEILSQLSELICTSMQNLQSLGSSLAQLDVLCAFALCAARYSYVRPKFSSEGKSLIKAGRHPVVEKMLAKAAKQFVANDCNLSSEERIWIITGPNMGGKSTFMRQVALITVMAQIGCFVPADYAELAIVDRLFCRIGASDDIARGQSTFMVEMCETASILAQATKNSLIVLDEVGRGTSTYDGLSIAASCVEYIANKLGSKCLFATHYHELTRLGQALPGVVNYAVATEEGQGVVFLYSVVKGVAAKSYGIHVATIAGLPKEVIERAKSILLQLEESSSFSTN
jgi:DNA mismatch repair protein MutS